MNEQNKLTQEARANVAAFNPDYLPNGYEFFSTLRFSFGGPSADCETVHEQHTPFWPR